MKRMIVSRKNIYVMTITLFTLVLLVMGACTPAPPSYTVNSSTKTGIGTYLVDGKGMTLYWTTRDSVGQSNITGTTLANWPIFYVSNVVVPSSLKASDFGSITRADGNMQTTFKGWPLYYYIKDQKPGDTVGQGVGGVWFVVNPAQFPPPMLVITSPSNNSTVPAEAVSVTVQVSNFKVVDKQGQVNAPREGHVHYYLDIDAPTAAGQPAIPASGIWAHVAATSYTFTNVGLGMHTITVQLVNNDHTPLVPPVVAKVMIAVTAGTTTAPPPPPANSARQYRHGRGWHPGRYRRWGAAPWHYRQ